MAGRNLYRYSIVVPVTYTILAPIYDTIMSHVDYEAWLSLINRIRKSYLTDPAPSILELGGGTGTLAHMLTQHGYSYHGSDVSFAMCREAHKKKVPFFCADAKKLPLKRSFDLILFLYDGINYLFTLDEYKTLFTGIYPCLTPGGCFLFDITTDANSRCNFIDYIDAENIADISYVRHSYYDTKKKIQHNDFTVFTQCPDNPQYYRKHQEYHAQKIFSVKEILSVVHDTDFRVCGVWDNFSFHPCSEHSDRIHFLLQKPGPLS